jgi:hypothetical protein
VDHAIIPVLLPYAAIDSTLSILLDLDSLVPNECLVFKSECDRLLVRRTDLAADFTNLAPDCVIGTIKDICSNLLVEFVREELMSSSWSRERFLDVTSFLNGNEYCT